MGDQDSIGLVEQPRALAAQLPDRILFAGRVYSSERAALAYLPIRGTTEDGGDYEWMFVAVKLLDEAGLVVVFDKQAAWAESMTFTVPQPLPRAPEAGAAPAPPPASAKPPTAPKSGPTAPPGPRP